MSVWESLFQAFQLPEYSNISLDINFNMRGHENDVEHILVVVTVILTIFDCGFLSRFTSIHRLWQIDFAVCHSGVLVSVRYLTYFHQLTPGLAA